MDPAQLVFSSRIVSVDSYMSEPVAGLDLSRSEFRKSNVKSVPVVRVFGSTPAGQTTCLHVHGIFPYLMIPYYGPDVLESHWSVIETYTHQLAAAIDDALNSGSGKSKSAKEHVFKIVLLRGIPFYGYHEEEELFLKIYFYLPGDVKRSSELLHSGTILDQAFQPHEAHVPYILQLFLDYNLYGMNLLHAKNCWFRLPIGKPDSISELPRIKRPDDVQSENDGNDLKKEGMNDLDTGLELKVPTMSQFRNFNWNLLREKTQSTYPENSAENLEDSHVTAQSPAVSSTGDSTIVSQSFPCSELCKSILEKTLTPDSDTSPLCPIHTTWTTESVPPYAKLPPAVLRHSTCDIEVDILAADISNRDELARPSTSNPGIAAIWEDERARRRQRDEDSQIATELSQPRVLPKNLSEREAHHIQILYDALDRYKDDNSMSSFNDSLSFTASSSLSRRMSSESLRSRTNSKDLFTSSGETASNKGDLPSSGSTFTVCSQDIKLSGSSKDRISQGSNFSFNEEDLSTLELLRELERKDNMDASVATQHGNGPLDEDHEQNTPEECIRLQNRFMKQLSQSFTSSPTASQPIDSFSDDTQPTSSLVHDEDDVESFEMSQRWDSAIQDLLNDMSTTDILDFSDEDSIPQLDGASDDIPGNIVTTSQRLVTTKKNLSVQIRQKKSSVCDGPSIQRRSDVKKVAKSKDFSQNHQKEPSVCTVVDSNAEHCKNMKSSPGKNSSASSTSKEKIANDSDKQKYKDDSTLVSKNNLPDITTSSNVTHMDTKSHQKVHGSDKKRADKKDSNTTSIKLCCDTVKSTTPQKKNVSELLSKESGSRTNVFKKILNENPDVRLYDTALSIMNNKEVIANEGSVEKPMVGTGVTKSTRRVRNSKQMNDAAVKETLKPTRTRKPRLASKNSYFEDPLFETVFNSDFESDTDDFRADAMNSSSTKSSAKKNKNRLSKDSKKRKKQKVVTKWIIVNRFKGISSMRVGLWRISDASSVKLTPELLRLYELYSPKRINIKSIPVKPPFVHPPKKPRPMGRRTKHMLASLCPFGPPEELSTGKAIPFPVNPETDIASVIKANIEKSSSQKNAAISLNPIKCDHKISPVPKKVKHVSLPNVKKSVNKKKFGTSPCRKILKENVILAATSRPSKSKKRTSEPKKVKILIKNDHDSPKEKFDDSPILEKMASDLLFEQNAALFEKKTASDDTKSSNAVLLVGDHNIKEADKDLENSDHNKTKNRKTGMNESARGNAELNGTAIGNTEVNETAAGNTKCNGTTIGNTKLNGTDTGNTKLNGTGIGNTELNGNAIGNAKINETTVGNTEFHETATNNPELNGTATENTDCNSVTIVNTGVNGTTIGSTELNGTENMNTELNGTENMNTELNGAGIVVGELNEIASGNTELNQAVIENPGDNNGVIKNTEEDVSAIGNTEDRKTGSRSSELVNAKQTKVDTINNYTSVLKESLEVGNEDYQTDISIMMKKSCTIPFESNRCDILSTKLDLKRNTVLREKSCDELSRKTTDEKEDKKSSENSDNIPDELQDLKPAAIPSPADIIRKPTESGNKLGNLDSVSTELKPTVMEEQHDVASDENNIVPSKNLPSDLVTKDESKMSMVEDIQTSIVTSPSTPVLMSPSAPAVTSPSTPAVTSPSKPVVTSPSAPVVTSRSAPVVTSSSGPVVTSPSSTAVTSTPIVTSPSTQIVPLPIPAVNEKPLKHLSSKKTEVEKSGKKRNLKSKKDAKKRKLATKAERNSPSTPESDRETKTSKFIVPVASRTVEPLCNRVSPVTAPDSVPTEEKPMTDLSESYTAVDNNNTKPKKATTKKTRPSMVEKLHKTSKLNVNRAMKSVEVKNSRTELHEKWYVTASEVKTTRKIYSPSKKVTRNSVTVKLNSISSPKTMFTEASDDSLDHAPPPNALMKIAFPSPIFMHVQCPQDPPRPWSPALSQIMDGTVDNDAEDILEELAESLGDASNMFVGLDDETLFKSMDCNIEQLIGDPTTADHQKDVTIKTESSAKDENEKMLKHFDKIFENVASNSASNISGSGGHSSHQFDDIEEETLMEFIDEMTSPTQLSAPTPQPSNIPSFPITSQTPIQENEPQKNILPTLPIKPHIPENTQYSSIVSKIKEPGEVMPQRPSSVLPRLSKHEAPFLNDKCHAGCVPERPQSCFPSQELSHPTHLQRPMTTLCHWPDDMSRSQPTPYSNPQMTDVNKRATSSDSFNYSSPNVQFKDQQNQGYYCPDQRSLSQPASHQIPSYPYSYNQYSNQLPRPSSVVDPPLQVFHTHVHHHHHVHSINNPTTNSSLSGVVGEDFQSPKNTLKQQIYQTSGVKKETLVKSVKTENITDPNWPNSGSMVQRDVKDCKPSENGQFYVPDSAYNFSKSATQVHMEPPGLVQTLTYVDTSQNPMNSSADFYAFSGLDPRSQNIVNSSVIIPQGQCRQVMTSILLKGSCEVEHHHKFQRKAKRVPKVKKKKLKSNLGRKLHVLPNPESGKGATSAKTPYGIMKQNSMNSSKKKQCFPAKLTERKRKAISNYRAPPDTPTISLSGCSANSDHKQEKDLVPLSQDMLDSSTKNPDGCLYKFSNHENSPKTYSRTNSSQHSLYGGITQKNIENPTGLLPPETNVSDPNPRPTPQKGEELILNSATGKWEVIPAESLKDYSYRESNGHIVSPEKLATLPDKLRKRSSENSIETSSDEDYAAVKKKKGQKSAAAMKKCLSTPEYMVSSVDLESNSPRLKLTLKKTPKIRGKPQLSSLAKKNDKQSINSSESKKQKLGSDKYSSSSESSDDFTPHLKKRRKVSQNAIPSDASECDYQIDDASESTDDASESGSITNYNSNITFTKHLRSLNTAMKMTPRPHSQSVTVVMNDTLVENALSVLDGKKSEIEKLTPDDLQRSKWPLESGSSVQSGFSPEYINRSNDYPDPKSLTVCCSPFQTLNASENMKEPYCSTEVNNGIQYETGPADGSGQSKSTAGQTTESKAPSQSKTHETKSKDEKSCKEDNGDDQTCLHDSNHPPSPPEIEFSKNPSTTSGAKNYFVTSQKPPSCSQVVEELKSSGKMSNLSSKEPFYGDKNDVQSTSSRLSNLPPYVKKPKTLKSLNEIVEFDSLMPLEGGIHHWIVMATAEKNFSEIENSVMRSKAVEILPENVHVWDFLDVASKIGQFPGLEKAFLSHKRSNITLRPARLPPSCQEVRQWLTTRKEDKDVKQSTKGNEMSVTQKKVEPHLLKSSQNKISRESAPASTTKENVRKIIDPAPLQSPDVIMTSQETTQQNLKPDQTFLVTPKSSLRRSSSFSSVSPRKCRRRRVSFDLSTTSNDGSDIVDSSPVSSYRSKVKKQRRFSGDTKLQTIEGSPHKFRKSTQAEPSSDSPNLPFLDLFSPVAPAYEHKNSSPSDAFSPSVNRSSQGSSSAIRTLIDPSADTDSSLTSLISGSFTPVHCKSKETDDVSAEKQIQSTPNVENRTKKRLSHKKLVFTPTKISQSSQQSSPMPFSPLIQNSSPKPTSKEASLHKEVVEKKVSNQDKTMSSNQEEMSEIAISQDVKNIPDHPSPLTLHNPQNEKKAGSQIDGPTLNNTYGFKAAQQHLGDAKSLHVVQHITMVSVELHVKTRIDLRPDPDLDEIRCLFYCLESDSWTGAEKGMRTGVIVVDSSSVSQNSDTNETLDAPSTSGQADSVIRVRELFKKSGVTGLNVTYVHDEPALFLVFARLIHQWDPDILIGYEVQMLSWGYLLQRAAHLRYDLCRAISRIPGDDQRNQYLASKDVYGADNASELHVVGRVVLNLWRLMRTEVALYDYSFESVAYHLLHERHPNYDHHTLTNWYDPPSRSGMPNHTQRWRVVDYYVSRVRGNMRLLTQQDFIGRTSELARLFGIQFYEVLTRGSQFRVESMLLRTARAHNLVAVTPSVLQRAQMRAPEVIALVMEPESKFYHVPVLVLDFQSLYPSMVIAYNLCYSTCLGRVELLGSDALFTFGCTSLRVPARTLNKLLRKNLISINPSGVAFVKSKVKRGMMPQMLDEILTTRIMVKNSMKKLGPEDAATKRMLDHRQLGLKLIANVTYGYTAANYSGRMPCVEIGDSIVHKARETLERAIQLVTRNSSKWANARVVYGDTDSMFIALEGQNNTGCSKDTAFRIGKEIAAAVTADNPTPVKLKFEKVYLPCVLQTKKRYVGYAYETEDQKEPNFDAKGIETVRRDGTPATAKILEKTLKILFDTRDLSKVKEYVLSQCSKILDGRTTLKDCIIAKEYRGKQYYKPGAVVPALNIARKMLAMDKRSEPRIGERVPYLIVHGAPATPLYQLVRTPLEVLRDPSLQLNGAYYVTKQVLPALDRVLSLLGVDVFLWHRYLPRTIHISHNQMMDNSQCTSKKATISQFFKSKHCLVCKKLSIESVCEACLSTEEAKQNTAVCLSSEAQVLERRRHHIEQVCMQCTGADTSSEIRCVSLDCPVLYKLFRATDDFSRTRALRKVLFGGEFL